MTYYYGLKDQERYTATDPEGALEEIENEYDADCVGMEIFEMKISRKYGEKYCPSRDVLIESYSCGQNNCEDYKPRNKINGNCIHSTYTVHETGRKWKIILGFEWYELEKISGRSRNEKSK